MLLLLTPLRRAVEAFLQAATVYDSAEQPFTATAEFVLYDGGSTSEGWDWRIKGPSNRFEVRATLLSGSASGTFNTWKALSVTRSWGVSRSSAGTSEASVRLEIRDTRDPDTILATSDISLSASVTFGGGGGGQ